MSRATIFLSLLICTGCAELVVESTPTVDEYSTAARSWIGAHIDEMLAAWPNPNMPCGSNTIGEAGCVWWRDLYVGQGDYHCEAIARYDEAGVITRIDVRRSRYCYRRFGDRFDRMTRRVSRKNIEIEDLGQ
jgi:hypothetical protein